MTDTIEKSLSQIPGFQGDLILLAGGIPLAGLNRHELNVYPAYSHENLVKLGRDIRDHGQHVPIVMYEGKVLDGYNRVEASRYADKLDIPAAAYVGKDPIGFILSMNEHRRHLTDDQRAMIAAKLATMERGRPGKTRQLADLSIGDAAAKMKVSKPSAERAKAVLNQDPALADEVGDGKRHSQPQRRKLP